MQWISVENDLPKGDHPVLGFCYICNGLSSWQGVMQVAFNRETGWRCCHNGDRNVRVWFWNPEISLPSGKHLVEYSDVHNS